MRKFIIKTLKTIQKYNIYKQYVAHYFQRNFKTLKTLKTKEAILKLLENRKFFQQDLTDSAKKILKALGVNIERESGFFNLLGSHSQHIFDRITTRIATLTPLDDNMNDTNTMNDANKHTAKNLLLQTRSAQEQTPAILEIVNSKASESVITASALAPAAKDNRKQRK